MPDNNDKKTEMTIESFQAEHSEIYTSVFNKGKADGEKAERDSFKELKDACGEGNLGIAVKCFEESKSTVEALQLCNEKLTAANLKLKEDAGKLPPKGTDPAKSEFNDDQQELTVDKNADETKLSDEQLTAKFEKSKDLQSEFTNDVKAYIAAVKHERDYGPIK